MTDSTTKVSRASKILETYNNLCLLPIYIGERIYYNKYKTSKIPSLHQNRIMIAGNGPSLKDIDLSSLKDKGIELLCVNYFAIKFPDFFKIKPKYYCLIDPTFYDATFSKDQSINNDVKNLYNCINKIDWDMYYICYSNQDTTRITNQHIKIIKISPIKYTGKYLRHSIYEKNKGNPGGMNVINAALYFAITGNAETVYLAGVDFSLHLNLRVDKNNIVYDSTNHFYKDNKRELENTKPRISGFSKDIEDYSCALKEIKYLSEYASYKKIKVLNTTINSFIDVFDKIPYDEINKYH